MSGEHTRFDSGLRIPALHDWRAAEWERVPGFDFDLEGAVGGGYSTPARSKGEALSYTSFYLDANVGWQWKDDRLTLGTDVGDPRGALGRLPLYEGTERDSLPGSLQLGRGLGYLLYQHALGRETRSVPEVPQMLINTLAHLMATLKMQFDPAIDTPKKAAAYAVEQGMAGDSGTENIIMGIGRYLGLGPSHSASEIKAWMRGRITNEAVAQKVDKLFDWIEGGTTGLQGDDAAERAEGLHDTLAIVKDLLRTYARERTSVETDEIGAYVNIYSDPLMLPESVIRATGQYDVFAAGGFWRGVLPYEAGKFLLNAEFGLTRPVYVTEGNLLDGELDEPFTALSASAGAAFEHPLGGGHTIDYSLSVIGSFARDDDWSGAPLWVAATFGYETPLPIAIPNRFYIDAIASVSLLDEDGPGNEGRAGVVVGLDFTPRVDLLLKVALGTIGVFRISDHGAIEYTTSETRGDETIYTAREKLPISQAAGGYSFASFGGRWTFMQGDALSLFLDGNATLGVTHPTFDKVYVDLNVLLGVSM